MDNQARYPSIQPGTTVLGFDGHKIGTIVAVRSHHLVVEKGYLAPVTYRIPSSAIAGIEHGDVLLNVTKNQALNQGWDAAESDTGRAVETGVLARGETGANDTLALLTA
jgi:hypothetical protein